jgi:CheY-like chemotaxis protein
LSKRILVIEDQEDNRQILRDLLTNADFEVIEAVDGEAGLAAATVHQPDLILMDIQLPGIDGYEARRLKADPVLGLSLSSLPGLSCYAHLGHPAVLRWIAWAATAWANTLDHAKFDQRSCCRT